MVRSSALSLLWCVITGASQRTLYTTLGYGFRIPTLTSRWPKYSLGCLPLEYWPCLVHKISGKYIIVQLWLLPLQSKTNKHNFCNALVLRGQFFPSAPIQPFPRLYSPPAAFFHEDCLDPTGKRRPHDPMHLLNFLKPSTIFPYVNPPQSLHLGSLTPLSFVSCHKANSFHPTPDPQLHSKEWGVIDISSATTATQNPSITEKTSFTCPYHKIKHVRSEIQLRKGSFEVQ